MYKLFIKRFIGFFGAVGGIILLSPLFIVICILLAISNKGKVFFTQERPGKGEKIFKVIKFKSMNDMMDQNGNLLPDRERLTAVGKFIRKTSLDELPQLINVLKGDMAFIGPRPLLIRYLPYYTDRERLRHTVRPGFSGWAQIHGRNTLGWDEKFEMDAWYAEHVSFALDVKIFFLTIYKVVKHEGAIADKKENYFDIERQNKINNKAI